MYRTGFLLRGPNTQYKEPATTTTAAALRIVALTSDMGTLTTTLLASLINAMPNVVEFSPGSRNRGCVDYKTYCHSTWDLVSLAEDGDKDLRQSRPSAKAVDGKVSAAAAAVKWLIRRHRARCSW